MENPSLSTKPRVVTVRKANYFMLLFPVGFLLFSIWAFSSMASEPDYGSKIQDTNSPKLSYTEVVLYGLGEIAILCVVALHAYSDKKLSVENISLVAFTTSYFTVKVSEYLQVPSNHWVNFLSLILLDAPAVLMIVTLLQDKSFAGCSLYQNKRVIVR